MQVKSRVPLISIRTPVLNVSKGLGHAMKTVPRGCLPQGLGSHMDLNWALDTMFHTAALDPHFCPKHPPPILLLCLPLSIWVHYTLPFSPWMVRSLEGRDIWSQAQASWVAFACFLSPWPSFCSSSHWTKFPDFSHFSPPLSCPPSLPAASAHPPPPLSS